MNDIAVFFDFTKQPGQMISGKVTIRLMPAVFKPSKMIFALLSQSPHCTEVNE
ncbi:MAG TPA: hypothetical protein VI585_19835 [Candidatus Binatia bacterium]